MTPIAVMADGRTFLVAGPVLLATGDRGRSWFRPVGLPRGVRAYADKANPEIAYAIDFAGSRVFVSRDGARTFRQVPATGLPRGFASEAPRNRESQPALLATPGRAGEIWLKLGGKLYRSISAGASFVRASGGDIVIDLFGLGKAAPGGDVPAIYAVGTKAGIRGIWRSDDGGRDWVRINDDAHQWGLRFRAISGDPRIHGRVYVATDGRGIFYGDPRP
jgi:photosystem II stability/assembly factor-like uncharacterized protein